MRNIVYFFVFDGFADWEAALALCEIRRPGDYRVRTVALDRRPVQSMGGLTVLPDRRARRDRRRARRADDPARRHGLGTRRDRAGQRDVRRLHAAGATIGALCSGVLALAYAGLLDTRRHTGNYAGHIETYVPDYLGSAHYDADTLAVSDDGVITSGGVGGIEFAREVIRALDLYDERDIGMWYRLFKHGVPPPWFAPASENVETEEERA